MGTQNTHELDTGSFPLPEEAWGKVAERLRRSPPYRNSRCVFVSPETALKQVRVNVLTDGKWLVIPSGSLTSGFLKVDPSGVPPAKRLMAADPRPDNPFAGKIPYQSVLSPPIDLMVSTARAAGRDGTRHGDGSGHLDLQHAILSELSWIAGHVQVVAIVDGARVFPALEVTDHDVDVHWIVTPWEAFPTGSPRKACGKILWDQLTPRQIRRNDPLFHLWGGRPPHGPVDPSLPEPHSKKT